MIPIKLAEAFVEIKADSKQLTTGLNKAQSQVGKSVDKISLKLAKIGKVMTVAGVAITAAFGLTVKSAMSFEKELAQVSTMLNKTTMSYMPKYKTALQKLSVQFGEATSTLSKGLYDILSASIDPAKALDVLAIAAKAASAGITDTGVAADAITTILNSYGFEAEEAGRISDQLFAIVKRGKTTFEELAPAIGKSASLAAQSGLSFEELGASIATMTRAGIRTDEAMTAVNGVLRSFLKPTEGAKEAAKELGIEFSTNTLRTEGLVEVLAKLKDATEQQLAAMFPNIRGLKGIAAALQNATGFAEDYKLMLNSAGLTEEAFQKQSDTLAFKLEQLKQAVNVVAITIGDVLIPSLKTLTEWAVKIAGKIKEWADANKPLVDMLVKITAGVGALMLVLGPLFMMLPGMVLAFTGLSTALKAIPGLATKAATGINTLGGAFLLGAANIIIWSEAWKEWKDLTEMLKDSTTDITSANEILAKTQEEVAAKLGISVEALKEFLKTGEKAAVPPDWDAYGKGLAELNKLAEKGELSASELYKAMRELAIETGVATEEIAELDSEMGTIVVTTEALTAEMGLLTKEYEAYGKSVEDSVKYYKDMIDKLNEVEVNLKTELSLLEEGTEAYNKKIAEIYDNAKALKGMQKALDDLIKPLEGLELINAKLVLIGDTVAEIPSKLNLLKDAAILLKKAWDDAIPETKAWYEAEKAYKSNQDAIEELTKSFDEYGKKGKELLTSLVELTDKQKKLQEAIDVIGVDKQNVAYQKLKISLNGVELQIGQTVDALNNLETEQKEAEEAAKNLADAYKEIADSLYELTHTSLENTIHKLDQQKEAYLKIGIAIKDVNKWYDLQIAKLKELNPELENTTKKINVLSSVTAEQLNEALGNAAKQINFATASLNDFTEAGMAAAIATIKMSFLPALNDIQESIAATKRMFDAGQLGLVSYANLMKVYQGQIDMVTGQMQEQIDTILYGYQEYQNILSGMTGGGTASGAGGWGGTAPPPATPAEETGTETGGGWGSYQLGTPYVPETGLYQLHRGEAVIPANQNTYNNTNTQNNTINIPSEGGNVQLIAKAVEDVLYDMGRQFKRRGFEIIPGRG